MNENSIQITKVTIHKGINLKVEYTRQTPDGANSVKETCKQNIHPDLVNAFGNLDDHLTHLTQQRNSSGEYANNEVHCNAYELSFNSENGDTVKLFGDRHMDFTKKNLGLETPSQNLSELGVDFYEYPAREELVKALEICDAEVRQYLFEGKHAPEPEQGEFDFDQENESVTVKKKKTKKFKNLTEQIAENLEGSGVTIEVKTPNINNQLDDDLG